MRGNGMEYGDPTQSKRWRIGEVGLSVKTFTSEISMGEYEGRAPSQARALRCKCKVLQQLNTTPLPALTAQPQLTI